MLTIWTRTFVYAALVVGGPATAAAQRAALTVDPEMEAKIKAALPDKAFAEPRRARRLLVFTTARGFRHSSIPVGARAIELMGQRTGAYKAEIVPSIEAFVPNRLAAFDAVLLLNTTGELFFPPRVEELSGEARQKAAAGAALYQTSLLNFIREGHGLIGIHAATDAFYEWPEYGAMIGGYFDGHPWHESVTLKLDVPGHPLTAMFEGSPTIVDEIYQFRDPYSRARQLVLLSLDADKTDMTKEGIKRQDRDFAVSWIRREGQGRVFYCSLGHREEIFWNPLVLKHYLAGIQYALGDLAAPDEPSAARRESSPAPTAAPQPAPAAGPQASGAGGFKPLFDGESLNGWKGLVADPPARARMSPAELAAAQEKADESMRAHWSVKDGVLAFDGAGDNLCTLADYGDFELKLEWKIAAGGDSGVYLRGSPQVQIWDPGQWPEGSGGLYNNEHNPSKPIARADRPVGQWNAFRIRLVGDRVSVWLNDVHVVDDVPLENYWERGKPMYARGPIELQAHKTPVWFRNIEIREIPAAEAAPILARPGWRELLNGKDTSGWQCKEGTWAIEDGALARRGGGDIWTADPFGDFTLDLEFKVAEKSNSGVFFRTASLSDPVQTGIELQVLDSAGKSKPGKHDCGAIYDCLEPAVNAMRAAGEWNHLVLRCEKTRIDAWMNGQRIIEMDLARWTEPHKNPDGTANKFSTAYAAMKPSGYIGFQDHGSPVWYRNIRIRPLD